MADEEEATWIVYGLYLAEKNYTIKYFPDFLLLVF